MTGQFNGNVKHNGLSLVIILIGQFQVTNVNELIYPRNLEFWGYYGFGMDVVSKMLSKTWT